MIDAIRNDTQAATNAPAAAADAPGEGFGDLIGQLKASAGAPPSGEARARASAHATRDAGTDRRALERLLQRRSTAARADAPPRAAGVESWRDEISRGRADQEASPAAPRAGTGASWRSKTRQDEGMPLPPAPEEANAGAPDPAQAAVVTAMTISGMNPPASPPVTPGQGRSAPALPDRAAHAAAGRTGMPVSAAPVAAASPGALPASPKATPSAAADRAGEPARQADDTSAAALTTGATVATGAPPGAATDAASTRSRIARPGVATDMLAAAGAGSERSASAAAAAADAAVVAAEPGATTALAARSRGVTGPIAAPSSAASTARPEETDTGRPDMRAGAPDVPAGGRAADRHAPVGGSTESPVAAGAAAILAAVGDAEHATAGGRGTRTGSDESEAGLLAATASGAAAGAAWTPPAAETATAVASGHAGSADAADMRYELSARLESAHFAGQFSDTVESLALQGIDQAELVVNPPELGPIRISLSMTGDTLSIAFASEHVETRQAIERSLPALQSALKEHGIELGDTRLGTGFDPRGGDGASSQRQPPDFPAAAGLPAARHGDRAGDEAQSASARQAGTSPRTPRLLDLFA